MTLEEMLIILALISGLVILFIKFLDFIENDAKSTWWVVAEGLYIHSSNQIASSRVTSGMTGHYAVLPPLVFTTIFFADREPVHVLNIDDLPPPGTPIKVLKNRRADFIIQKVNP